MESEMLKTLVVKAAAGDVDAYGEIVRQFQDMACGYAFSLLGDFHWAQDAAQEAFLEAYRQLPKLQDPQAFAGWFRQIVWSKCRRITRAKEPGTIPLTAAEGVAIARVSPAQKAEQREMSEKVLTAIHALPEHQRTVTTLFYINGYSQSDIAEFLEVTVTTVKKRLHDSRNQLKERMDDMVKDEIKRHSLPEDFTRRVLTLVEIMESGAGKRFLFQYANGVKVFTRVDKVIRDKNQFHYLLCGPTDIQCHGPDHVHLNSFVLIPNLVVTVVEICQEVNPRVHGGQYPSEHEITVADATQYVDPRRYGQSYEIAGPDEPRFLGDQNYRSSPVVTGFLDIVEDAPPHAFGFIRVGKKQAPAAKDIYVSITLIQKYNMKKGNIVRCIWRQAVGNERYRSAVEILAVNGKSPEPRRC
ncbi:MAG: sigma-70 family RNA polymerase sigma factor [Phycisphaerae bacterium]